MSSKFFTNKDENTLFNKLDGLFKHNPNLIYFDAVVGFLRASGYFAIRPLLTQMKKVRVLIGIDVDKYIATAERQGKLFLGEIDGVKSDALKLFYEDIEKSGYKKDIEDGILNMGEDIRSGHLELRAHPSKKIHAKVYILYPADFNEDTLNAAAITGSSNLSGNGLGISNERQYEFNVLLQENQDVSFAKKEFDALWEEAKDCPIETSDVQTIIDTTYLHGDVTPYEVYIKMLMEYYGERVNDSINENPYEMPKGYQKKEFQLDAVNEGYGKLMKYNGFFLADVVGLGKTITAAMIAKKFILENGKDETKILVVYPPAVEENWKTTFKDFNIDKYSKFISNRSLKKVLDEDDVNYWNADEYDLIIVDEAHKFRNHESGMFELLQEICKMPRTGSGNIKGLKKKVMLLSATPMNNSPEDLYYEIQLFQDARRCTIDGVPNLSSIFNEWIKQFKQFKNHNLSLEKYLKSAEHVREKVIKPITVRRTRTDIEEIPRYKKDCEDFPKVDKPRMERYVLNEKESKLFDNAMDVLIYKLKYSRYQAIARLLPEKSSGLYDNVEMVSKSLAFIMKTAMVKRLESSFYAFMKSLERFKDSNQYMINMFNNNKVFIAPDLDINNLYSQGYTDEDIEEMINEKAETNPKNHVFEKNDFEPNYYKELLSDQELLDKMFNDWQSIDPEKEDPKFDKFYDLLEHEFFKADINTGKKLVIFSESAETIEYLRRRLNKKDILAITAKNRNEKFKIIRENFDANCNHQKDDYNIIIATNALSEGINLHRSNIVVNYDTPWTATILLQRIGRVNRIGSKAEHIYNYVFYPSDKGDAEIELNRKALAKLQTFHSAFGEDSQIYSTQEIINLDLVKLFDVGLPAEEQNKEMLFYEELRDLYINNRKEYNRIQLLSLRSRTGRRSVKIQGVTLHNDTLVFLKTNIRKVFYRASDNSVDELNSLEAFEYFKAAPNEEPVERIINHFEHVSKAKFMFDQLLSNQDIDNVPQNRTAQGAQAQTAIKLLKDLIDHIQDTKQRLLLEQLKAITDRGIITSIPKKLSRIARSFKNRSMTYTDMYSQVIELAKKYNSYYMTDKVEQKNKEENSASIILSESFN